MSQLKYQVTIIEVRMGDSACHPKPTMEHVGHYGSLNLEAMHESTFLGISGIINGGDILELSGEYELEVGK